MLLKTDYWIQFSSPMEVFFRQSLVGHWNSEMKMKFLFRVPAGLFIALENKTIKAFKTALLCPCQGDEVDLQRQLHCNLGFFTELCHCMVLICV